MRQPWTAFLLAIAMTASMATFAASDASANYNPPVYMKDRPSFVGWASIDDTYCAAGSSVASYCTRRYVSYACTNVAPCASGTYTFITGYRWANGRWSAVSLRSGSAYLYPYASGWAWAWRQDTGWVAIRAEFGLISPGGSGSPGCPACQ